MYSVIDSAVICGIDGLIVKVETDICNGLPCFEIVGDVSLRIKESRGRIRTAIRNSGYKFEPKKIIVNISPGNVRKDGTLMDLPIAVSILSCFGIVNEKELRDTIVIGELGLDGSLKPVWGTISIVISAKEAGYKRCIVPSENVDEGNVIDGIAVIGVRSLREVVDYINGKIEIDKRNVDFLAKEDDYNIPDFDEVNGQEAVKRACEIAAAGLHNMLMIGSPGSGKTMIAKRLPYILPSLTKKEQIEVAKIYSVHKGGEGVCLVTKRPFRSPHHTITLPSLIGGGNKGRLGEVSLAHKGVLFLDEYTEFDLKVLEALRQPLEDGKVNISRVGGKFEYPANFMLVAAMNPCKCGYYPDYKKCNCSEKDIMKYMGKISGPLMDRMDICVQVSTPEYKDIVKKKKGESTREIKRRVEMAREIQIERYLGSEYSSNADLDAKGVENYCCLSKKEKEYMEKVYYKMNLTARGFHRVLKTARTIADLEGNKQIEIRHLAESISYRFPDKKYWER